MTQKLNSISVCIWDFDGTLYRQIPALWDEIRVSELRVIMDHTGWSMEKAKEEFYKRYKVETPSGTKTVSMITGVPSAQASQEMGRYTDYRKYLKHDEKLTALFESLHDYIHMMLVNGSVASVHKGLDLLGVSEKYFTRIFTSDIIGESKPSTKGFRAILEKTGLPAEQHVMIGDREPVDLAPAKSLGLKTCLVWSDTPGEIADVTVPTVYEVAHVLGK